MRLHAILLNQTVKQILPGIFLVSFTAVLLFFNVQGVLAQCYPNPTGETAVGLLNDSSFFLTLYIDNVKKAGVPSGSKSADFIVTPGRHILYAEAIIKGESIWVTLIGDIPEGFVCTWTIVDPETKSRKKIKGKMIKSLRRK